MNDSYWFLERLGLGEDTDERAVRRAYARELKRIDQEADPEGFQHLRAAYETAGLWLRHRAEQAAQAEPASDAPTVEATAVADAALPAAVEACGGRGTAAAGDAVSADAIATEPDAAGRDPRIDAAVAVFEQFLAGCGDLAARGVSGESPWRDVLQAALDDPRLLGIQEREIFEWHVAALLASGWRPGHESLLVAAAKVFRWSEDRRRVVALGQPGHIVDSALEERIMFDLQSDEEYEAQRQIIARLRHGPAPSPEELLALLPLADAIRLRYPYWLPIVTDVAAIDRWHEQERTLPAWRRRLATFRTRRRDPSPPASSSGPNWAYIAVLLLLFGSKAMLKSDPPPDPAPMAVPLVSQAPAPRFDTLPGQAPAYAHQYVAVPRQQPPEPGNETIGDLIQSRIDYTLPSVMARPTAVEFEVDLDAAGHVVSLRKTMPSLLPAYDDAVERAVRAAAPYPARAARQFSLLARPRQ